MGGASPRSNQSAWVFKHLGPGVIKAEVIQPGMVEVQVWSTTARACLGAGGGKAAVGSASKGGKPKGQRPWGKDPTGSNPGVKAQGGVRNLRVKGPWVHFYPVGCLGELPCS